MKAALICTLFLTITCVGVASRAGIVSTFDSDAEGWAHAAGGDASSSVSFVGTGGNPDGHIQLSEPAGGGIDRFAAPAKFLGDKLAYYGGVLRYDMKVNNSETAPIHDDVILKGGGLELVLAISTSPATDSFTTFQAELIETSGWQLSTGGVPTQSQFQSVMGDLTDLHLLAEWTNGTDVTQLDNVTMTLVPGPPVVPVMPMSVSRLLAFLILGVGIAASRRRTAARSR